MEWQYSTIPNLPDIFTVHTDTDDDTDTLILYSIDYLRGLSCDFFERVHMYAFMHWNIADVPVFFFGWPSLFFPDFFVILLADGVSECACAHVRMCSPLILA